MDHNLETPANGRSVAVPVLVGSGLMFLTPYIYIYFGTCIRGHPVIHCPCPASTHLPFCHDGELVVDACRHGPENSGDIAVKRLPDGE